jgi:hypothetical protein
MMKLRNLAIITVAISAFGGVANADLIIGFQTSTGAVATDITNFAASLPGYDPGDSSMTLSNVSGAGYTTGVSMASLNAMSGFTYTLIGYNISVDETLTGNYTLTNTSSNSTATGNAHVDTYTAVSLGSMLAPPLSNTSDPTNDLYNCAATGVGAVNMATGCSGNDPGEQPSSTGGGPDPNTPQTANFTLAPNGGSFNSGAIMATSKWVDFGCEIMGDGFSQDNTAASFGAGCDLSPAAAIFNPNLAFFFSTATQTTQSVTGGNLSSTYNTSVNEQIEITYDIAETPTSSTPEPMTMGVLGAGLLGLGLMRRRLKK